MAKNELDLQMEDYQYLPLRDVVFRTLRQAILRGELKPGERLMEIRLANQLGVSRTPIREAIRMLELDGLVIMVPRKGAQVAQITEKDLNDVLEVRLGLEELAVKLACQRITESELQKLYQASRRSDGRARPLGKRTGHGSVQHRQRKARRCGCHRRRPGISYRERDRNGERIRLSGYEGAAVCF